MKVEKQIDDSVKHRGDLVRIMDAAAEFLASRDTETDSQAVASWQLWSYPNGEVWIGVDIHDQDFFLGEQCPVRLMADTDDRELRLVHLWNKVLRARTRREIARGNDLISQYQGE
jgi:hypothetical protein